MIGFERDKFSIMPFLSRFQFIPTIDKFCVIFWAEEEGDTIPIFVVFNWDNLVDAGGQSVTGSKA
jgi:hypothetical protein